MLVTFCLLIFRVAVLLTDGQSNIISINEFASALKAFGVQVYTVGIANVFLPELLFIASDPDPLHVFLLDSFGDASGFVDFLSFTTCDSKEILIYTCFCLLMHVHIRFNVVESNPLNVKG